MRRLLAILLLVGIAFFACYMLRLIVLGGLLKTEFCIEYRPYPVVLSRFTWVVCVRLLVTIPQVRAFLTCYALTKGVVYAYNWCYTLQKKTDVTPVLTGVTLVLFGLIGFIYTHAFALYFGITLVSYSVSVDLVKRLYQLYAEEKFRSIRAFYDHALYSCVTVYGSEMLEIAESKKITARYQILPETDNEREINRVEAEIEALFAIYGTVIGNIVEIKNKAVALLITQLQKEVDLLKTRQKLVYLFIFNANEWDRAGKVAKELAKMQKVFKNFQLIVKVFSHNNISKLSTNLKSKVLNNRHKGYQF